MRKVLLISLFGTDYQAIRLLAACLKEKGHEAHIVTFKEIQDVLCDIEHENSTFMRCWNGLPYQTMVKSDSLSQEDLLCLKNLIVDFDPDIVGVGAVTAHKEVIPNLLEMLNSIGKNYLKLVGGIGATIEAEFFLDAGFDVVLRGESEDAIVELVDSYEKSEDLYKIKNSVWKLDGKYIYNDLREQYDDLTKLPFPLYGNEFVSYIEDGKLYKNRDLTLENTTTDLFIGRGCIGKCTFCCDGHLTDTYKEQGIKVKKYRTKSIEYLFNEIKSRQLTNTNFIMFNDDMFFGSQDYMTEFFTRYKNEVNIPFFLYLKYDKFLKNDELFDLAIDAGLIRTNVAIQTGCEDFSRNYYHRHYKNTLYSDYAWKLYDSFVGFSSSFIGGNCYETDEVFFKTVDIIKQLPYSILNPMKTTVNIFKLTPYPKTKIIELCPEVLAKPMPIKEWYRRSLIWQLSQVISKEEAVELFYNENYKKDVYALQDYYYKTLAQNCINELDRYKAKWKDKNVVIYGAGSVLANSYDLIKAFKPKAILLDKEFINFDASQYNLPVYEVNEYLTSNKDTHVIVMSQAALKLARKIRHLIPKEQVLEYGLYYEPSRHHSNEFMEL